MLRLDHFAGSTLGYEERFRELADEQLVVASCVKRIHMLVLAAFAYDDAVWCDERGRIVEGDLVHILPEHSVWNAGRYGYRAIEIPARKIQKYNLLRLVLNTRLRSSLPFLGVSCKVQPGRLLSP